jgi:hypothetical protein
VKRRPRFSCSGAKAIAGGAPKVLFGRFLGRFKAPVSCCLSILRGLVLPCLVAFPSLAQAAPILLVKPSGSDIAILEAFNRLRGELHVHGFQILLVESPHKARSGAAALAAMTERHGALAGVYLVRGSKPARADLDRGPRRPLNRHPHDPHLGGKGRTTAACHPNRGSVA